MTETTNQKEQHKHERNSEGILYLILILVGAVLAYFHIITGVDWMILAGSLAAFYGSGRIVLKTLTDKNR